MEELLDGWKIRVDQGAFEHVGVSRDRYHSIGGKLKRWKGTGWRMRGENKREVLFLLLNEGFGP